MSWKTAVNIDLIVSNDDLCEIIFGIAPNNVIQPARMSKAIEYEDDVAQINFTGESFVKRNISNRVL